LFATLPYFSYFAAKKLAQVFGNIKMWRMFAFVNYYGVA